MPVGEAVLVEGYVKAIVLDEHGFRVFALQDKSETRNKGRADPDRL